MRPRMEAIKARLDARLAEVAGQAAASGRPPPAVGTTAWAEARTPAERARAG